MNNFNDLLCAGIGIAYAKQLALADYIGDRGWNVDLVQAKVTFGDDIAHSIQLLGSESEGDSSWLWAWANEASNLPDNLLVACNKLRKFGESKQVNELTDRSFGLTDEVNGHNLALLASSMNESSCYYRGPYNGGALFFLVTDVPQMALSEIKTERVIRVVSEIIAQFTLNHKNMAHSFLDSLGFKISKNGSDLTASRNGQSIELKFDGLDRLTGITGVVQPKIKKNSWWKFW